LLYLPVKRNNNAIQQHLGPRESRQPVKALSLTQPWASLVAIGAKRIETRSWRTSYRGPLAIHASKSGLAWSNISANYLAALKDGGITTIEELPFGKIVAICRLLDCIPTEEAILSISRREETFGDYSPGRWAWLLSDIEPLLEHVPAKGALGLWEWNPGPHRENILGARGL
jgi:activating signal cointegrator 1